jgi:hypothetical protein
MEGFSISEYIKVYSLVDTMTFVAFLVNDMIDSFQIFDPLKRPSDNDMMGIAQLVTNNYNGLSLCEFAWFCEKAKWGTFTDEKKAVNYNYKMEHFISMLNNYMQYSKAERENHKLKEEAEMAKLITEASAEYYKQHPDELQVTSGAQAIKALKKMAGTMNINKPDVSFDYKIIDARIKQLSDKLRVPADVKIERREPLLEVFETKKKKGGKGK